MYPKTSIARSFVAASSVLVAISMAAGCGQNGADARAADVEKAADSVAQDASKYAGDPWEQRAKKEYWAKQNLHDSWDRAHLGQPRVRTPRNAPSSCD